MAKRSKRKAPKPVAKSSAPTGEILRPKQKTFPWKQIFQALVIVAAGLWIYWPALHGDWLWDDDYLISQNALIHDPDGLWNIWFNPSTLIDYFPLTVSLEWLEWQIWPNDTFCYHLTSVLLHVCSALLVWRLFGKLGLRLAWLGGLLFAIHPVMVESVAWIAELKNTLSLPPFLLAMCCWIDYERRGKQEDYFLAMGLFLVAMLCKTTMVMFPVVILLYAWWKRDRIRWTDLIKSAPFFAISLAVGLTLVAFLRHGVGEETIPLGGVSSRLACAGLSIAFYFSKCFLPVGLSPMYPQWPINPPSPAQLLPWPILAGALYWLWTKRHRWGRHVLLGLGFFLLNLAPFIGFRAISFMRFVWVMDHFLYLPIIGLIGLVIVALAQVDERLSASTRPYRIGVIAMIMALMAYESHRHAKIYFNSIELWTYTIQLNPDAWPAHNDLGNALSDANRFPEAKIQYEEALRLNPGYPEAHNNLGIILFRLGEVPEAIAQFKETLRLCPDLASAQENLIKVQDIQKNNPTKK